MVLNYKQLAFEGNNILIVELPATNLDRDLSLSLIELIEEMLANKKQFSIIVDLININNITCTGLSSLIYILHKAKNNKCLFIMTSPNKNVENMLKSNALDNLFTLKKSLIGALETTTNYFNYHRGIKTNSKADLLCHFSNMLYHQTFNPSQMETNLV